MSLSNFFIKTFINYVTLTARKSGKSDAFQSKNVNRKDEKSVSVKKNTVEMTGEKDAPLKNETVKQQDVEKNLLNSGVVKLHDDEDEFLENQIVESLTVNDMPLVCKVVEPLKENIDKISNAIGTFEKETGVSLEEERKQLQKIILENKLDVGFKKCIRISLAGPFSSGKSSFINSLLDDDCALAPVKDIATTRVVTRFTYGKDRKIFDKDGNELTLEQYQKKVVDTKEGKNIFTIQVPADFLKNIVLSDVPGFDSGDHGEIDCVISQKENANADIIFYLFKCGDGSIKSSGINYLIGDNKSKGILNGGDKQKSLYVILTQADRKSRSERENIKKYNEKVLKKWEIKFDDICLYSSTYESEKKLKDEDKEFFKRQKNFLYEKIVSLANVRNDFYNQRMLKRNEKLFEKNRIVLQDLLEKIRNGRSHWLYEYEQKKIDNFFIGKTKKSLHEDVDKQWNDFENSYLGKKIDNIEFCKYADNAVRQCPWYDEWERVIRDVGAYFEDNHIDSHIRSYFNIGYGSYKEKISVNEMPRGRDWLWFSTEEYKRRSFEINENQRCRSELKKIVHQVRESMLKQLDNDFNSEFQHQKEFETNFNNVYKILLNSIKGE